MRTLTRLLRHGVLVGFLILSAYPLLWMCLAAIQPEGDVQQNPFALPKTIVFTHLRTVLSSGLFGRAYLNSILVCAVGVTVAVAFSALAAFAFAHLPFRGSRALFLLFLLGMMIPIHVTLIPLNRLLGQGGLGLKGTLWALIGPYVGFALPITILILRGAFLNVPRDLLEAARIDGCSTWGTFWHVGLPLVKPALATVIIFNVLTMWNEFAFALTLLDPDTPTLPIAITQFRGEHDIQIAQTCAALAIVVLPLLAVYFVAQKHIIRGLTAGAVKE